MEIDLVTRDVRVSVEQDVSPLRCTSRGDMDEVKGKVFPHQGQFQGPGWMEIVISSYHLHGYAQLFELDQRVRIADIAQMPDFVGSLQLCGKV